MNETFWLRPVKGMIAQLIPCRMKTFAHRFLPAWLAPVVCWVFGGWLMVGPSWAGEPIPIQEPEGNQAVSFQDDILPILQKNCLACHSAGERQGNLILESPQAMLKGGDNGPALIASQGSQSLILALASHRDEPVMPPEDNDVAAQNLTSLELGKLKRWIDQGAKGQSRIDSLSPKQWHPLPSGVHPVQAVAITDDGQFVACSRANQIFLYHVPTGQLVTKLADPDLDEGENTGIAHRDLVQSLAFNVDGDLLASGGFREVKIWKRPRDVQRRQFPAASDARTMAVSPDHHWIAVPNDNHSIQLFEAASGQPGPLLTGHQDQITSLRFTIDGKQLVSGSLDRSVRTWDVASGNLQGILETGLPVNAVELIGHTDRTGENAENTQRLVTGDGDNAIGVWEFPLTKPEKLNPALSNLTNFATNRDGSRLAVLDQSQRIRIVSLSRGTESGLGAELASLRVESEITAFALLEPNGGNEAGAPGVLANQGLVTGSPDGFIRIWDLKGQQVVRQWKGDAIAVTAVAVSDDGAIAASGLDDGQIVLWDLKPNDDEQVPMLHQIPGNKQAITDLFFHSNGRMLFVTAADGSLRSFNTQDGKQAWAASHNAAVNDLAVSPNEQILATAGQDSIVRLWKIDGGVYSTRQLEGADGPIQTVSFSPDSQRLIASTTGKVSESRLYDLAQGELVQRSVSQDGMLGSLFVPPSASDSSDAARVSILTVSDSGVAFWNDARVRKMTGHSQPITSLAADPESERYVYSGSLDGSIRRWDLQTGQAVRQFNHGAPVHDISVASDGQRIASAGDNGTAKLFRNNGQQIAELRGDIRLAVAQQRARQALTSSVARVNLAKRSFEDAEKDVPKKTEAEKKLSDELAAANREVMEKQSEVDKALSTKIAAETTAIQASGKAKEALAKKEDAELRVQIAESLVQTAQGKLTQLQRAAAANADNEEWKRLVDTAQKELEQRQKEVKDLTEAVKAPTAKASEMAQAANAAAQKVNEVQKPYTDATAALKLASSQQNLLSQQHALAAKELTEANDLVPIRKQAWDRAEAAKTEADQLVTTTTEALKSAEKPIRSIDFSADGSLLATAGDFSSCHTWDGQTGQAVAAFASPETSSTKVVFLGDQTMATLTESQGCRVWELNPEWLLQRTIGDVKDPGLIVHRATAVDFRKDSSQLVVASGIPSRSGELHVFELADGSRSLHLPQAHEDVIYSARFSPDGQRIASGAADKCLRTFDTATSRQLRKFEGHTGYVLGVSWKSDGEAIATSSADHTIKIWEAETGDQRRTINQQLTKHVTAVQYIGDTDNVVSSSGDQRVRIHNSNNGGVARNFSNTKSWQHCVAVTPDGTLVATGEADGTMTIWNGTNGQLLHQIPSPTQN